MYSIDDLSESLKENRDFAHMKPDFAKITDDIHDYKGAIRQYRKRLTGQDAFDPGTVGAFIDMLRITGLSPGRQVFYACRLGKILALVRGAGFAALKDIDADGAKGILAEIISCDYKGETKSAYAITLKRLVHFAKTGNTRPERGRSYTPEISWIVPSQYRSTRSHVTREDLLTEDEIRRMTASVLNLRDRAMIWVMFEGAFRPGELLNMRVGGVEFADRYMMISTAGKTGNKHLALVLSLKPVLDWISIHPFADDPEAPLWYSHMSKGKGGALSYAGLNRVIKRAASAAAIQKPVWGYLLRHTQLTNLSKKLPDQLLRVYGNWRPGSKMSARYTHLSAQDAKDAILALHGIKEDAQQTTTTAECPRCGQSNPPGLRMCAHCGLLVSVEQRAQVDVTDLVRSRFNEKIARSKVLESTMDDLFEKAFKG